MALTVPTCILRSMCLVAAIVLSMAPLAGAQSSSSTFTGRVVDEGEAVLPGVTITVTHTSTGVVRTAVTNEEGAYLLPGLDPGVYSIRTELPGFAPSVREGVTLVINSTLTLDFRLALAGVSEAVTVTGAAPLIEVTQSKVASTIETTELQNLPMITRSVSGLLALLPGAAPVEALHRSKESVGSVSYGGSVGSNNTSTVDGADNRDNRYGGPLMTFSTDAIEQFQLSTSQFTAADGRTGGSAVTMVTKSGTNLLRGTAFVFGRDQELTAKDYFAKVANEEKAPFSRQQFGGSIGGPILRNRMFFFGAIEQIYEDLQEPVPDNQFNELERLVTATGAGQLAPGLVNPNHPRSAPTGGELTLSSVKINGQLTNNHSLMGRFAHQRDDRDNPTFTSSNDLREPEYGHIRMYSAVVQHGWVLGNKGLNQITGQVNHLGRLSDVTSAITGEHYTRDFPNVNFFPPRLSFPSVNTGAGGSGGSVTDTYVVQIKDDVSLISGNHTMRFGGNFNYLPDNGSLNANEHFVTLTFFDDPSVILSNSNGRYPQGLATPGIVRQWQQANGGALNGVGDRANSLTDLKQVSGWFQDDWRATSRLTLNLGIRYDIDFQFYDQKNYRNNATRLVLEDIGHPYAALPKSSTKDFSPRVGFAYDLSGDGRRVVRGGYGLYFDQYNTGSAAGDITALNRRPLNALATLTNTAIGVGQLATYRFGIDPLPPQPTEGNSLPRGSAGQWMDPNLIDPRNHQVHVGYAHTLAGNTMVAADYTHIEGLKELRQLNLNPIVNGQRLLAPDFIRVYGIPNVQNAINVRSSINKSRYDALTFRFQRRLPRATIQAHYTIAGAYAYGGSTGNRSGAGLPQDTFDPLADSEWGPVGNDERHRLVAMGVFELPYGIQLSPVFQAASARPYNLTAGTDLNADGQNNDRYIDPATREQVSINSARGDTTTVLDLRTTKFFGLGGERRIGVFVELFNVFDTVNFGNNYGGNARGSTFRQPTAFMPVIGYPRQLQLGARFLF